MGIHPEKLNVHNKTTHVHPEKLPVYDKSPFVKNHDINPGIQDHFYGSPDDYIETQNVCDGSQCMGTSPVPAGNISLFVIIGRIVLMGANFC